MILAVILISLAVILQLPYTAPFSGFVGELLTGVSGDFQSVTSLGQRSMQSVCIIVGVISAVNVDAHRHTKRPPTPGTYFCMTILLGIIVYHMVWPYRDYVLIVTTGAAVYFIFEHDNVGLSGASYKLSSAFAAFAAMLLATAGLLPALCVPQDWYAPALATAAVMSFILSFVTGYKPKFKHLNEQRFLGPIPCALFYILPAWRL